MRTLLMGILPIIYVANLKMHNDFNYRCCYFCVMIVFRRIMMSFKKKLINLITVPVDEEYEDNDITILTKSLGKLKGWFSKTSGK